MSGDRVAALPWFRFRGPGGGWLATLASHETSAAFDGAPRNTRYVGMCCPAERRIYVDTAEPRRSQDEVTLHELMHAALSEADLPPRQEERVVNALAPRLLPILMQLGFQLPPRPPQARRLERHARMTHEA